MKIFIAITLVAAIANFAVAGLITHIITGKIIQTPKKWHYVLLFLLIGNVLFFAGGVVLFESYYRAGETAKTNMESDNEVAVKEIDEGYFFDGSGSDKAYIFFPGARVEATAYAPILHSMADKGIDCFLVKMPLNMAMLGKDKADDIIDEYDYDEWYIGGHSLGGAMASVYLDEHQKDLDGLILMAAYPARKMDDSKKLVSLVGDNDQVLNWDKYNEMKSNWPGSSIECVIKGGNHAEFGDYGRQSGDGEASISPDEQQSQATECILDAVLGEDAS